MNARWLRAFLLAGAFVLLSGAAQAKGQVVAIIVGATDDATIGPGVNGNVAHMRTLLGQLETISGIASTTFYITGQDFRCSRIVRLLRGEPEPDGRRLRVTSDDTVLFYYAGHGSASQDAGDALPTLDCSRAFPEEHNLTLSGIMETIHGLKPRLAIGLADACNSYPPLPGGPQKGAGAPAAETLKHLFQGYRGMLAMSATSRGEEAWYVNVPTGAITPGGIFTTAMLNAIGDNFATWPEIRQRAIVPLRIPGRGAITQTPAYNDYGNDPARRLTPLP